MDKQDAYQLMLMALDQGKVSPAEIVDFIYDNGYIIESRLTGEDAAAQDKMVAANKKSRQEWGEKNGR